MSAGSHQPSEDTGRIRVMLVDDSAVIRGFMTRLLENENDIQIVASAVNGKDAVDKLTKTLVDVIVLDIEMPVMTGMEALPKLLAIKPDVRIIMASTLTMRNADISIRALGAGAADYIPKPTTNREIGSDGNDYNRELLSKIRSLGVACRRAARLKVLEPGSRSALNDRKGKIAPAKPIYDKQITLVPKKLKAVIPDALVIGSSTGGPNALLEVLRNFPGNIKQPIFITQHMPANFTKILASHISQASGRSCAEAIDGEIVMPGKIYLAPGDYHMTVGSNGLQKIIKLNQGPQENFCRPSVEPMLRSLVSVYKGRLLTVILTGMGSDGSKSAPSVVEAGGTVIAQDEKTSVVWGMPGAVATAGICTAVLPLKEISTYINSYMIRGTA